MGSASDNRSISESLRKLSGTYLKDVVSFIICNVNSVDKVNRVCDCVAISGNANTLIPSVQLCAENSDGFVVFPAVGSTVIVALSIRNNAYIQFFSEVDEIVMYWDNGTLAYSFDFNADGNGLQQFNDGKFGGLIKVKDPTDPTVGLLKKINNLENLVNNLIVQYNLHTHPYLNGVTPAITSPTSQQEAGSIAPITTETDLTNPNITHGLNIIL